MPPEDPSVMSKARRRVQCRDLCVFCSLLLFCPRRYHTKTSDDGNHDKNAKHGSPAGPR
ncbi:hypothetical protein BD413DRAFT_575597 [Trametes elegans]|nr:hypothetical protein BD413DRAFT_575597 [Trametes elegans]